ncbi:glycine betaine uptake BCCT transporter [Anoxybacteroides rupiense]|uniref:glycine betaine uptake BCCT transporter n=1 Tax=Anoxybacteroides rupiense TaxID=311460 RepID=UPI0016061532|nr:BCCT family transporter [Anoxybacillus rupiensis]MBB3906056.1 glycine betaine transporter [Anoxybacillus rupiensis]
MNKATKVFYCSVLISLFFIIWGMIPKSMLPHYNLNAVSVSVHSFLINKFGWFYLLAATTFLGFCLFLIFSKYGSIRLGQDHEKPEYSYRAWFAMLFSAGMGIGLVFWGVAEPVSHYYNPPVGEGKTTEAARVAMRYSFFHWGLHPWAIYGVVALALAYFQFRKKEPGVISRVLRPLFGNKVDGAVGIAVDTLSVYATIFGVATSLGLGAIQISGGLSHLFPYVKNNIATQLIIIGAVTILFMLSAQSGLNKGIKILSNINIVLALLLMLFLLFVGPTNFIMDVFTTTIGTYVQNLPSMSLRLSPFEQSDWPRAWTIFYWAWWIAWAPFVGTFIARISRGRTIREFVIGVLVVPTVFSALWFSVFGGSSLYLEQFNHVRIMEVMEADGMEAGLFFVLQHFPFGMILSGLAILLICTFFVTSADSATFVLGMQTTNGSLFPPNSIKFIWGIIQSASAAILLWTGGLQALQTASIIAAFPFTIIIILMVSSLIRSFKEEMPSLK